MDESKVILLVLVLSVPLAIIISIFYYRCPHCGRLFALKRTKEKKGFWLFGQEMWKCKYCGHTKWKDRGDGIAG